MAKKGCGALLFVSVVLFCAGMSYLIVTFFSIILAWMTMGKVTPNYVYEIVFFYIPWAAALAGAIVGIFWARAMLREDK